MIKFGTVSTANITPRALIYPCVDEPNAMVGCVASRDKARAEGFAQWHGIPQVHGNYESVIDDDRINAFYNPLPISMHKEWSIRALEAGKHVLCEKSFASNELEAQEIAEVAKRTELVAMDAFHYRYHPVFIRAKQILDQGELGRVHHIEAAFHVPISDPKNIRFDYALGGGVTMDIGCYPISWVRHLVGEEPEVGAATSQIGPPDVDVFLEADLVFPSGVTAKISGDMREKAQFKMDFKVHAERGTLYVRNPLIPQNGHIIEVSIEGEKRTETCDRRPTYSYQLDAFIAAIENQSPLFTGCEDAVKQMRVIDSCYKAAGLPVRGLSQ
ncbi:Gfo/Idh/MocA family oxidoreductase [Gammaproteobacteria bacterium]|nr:Gfo/Idh/MocA family oxidoreductase [Gammaproteobacteria bacterium]